MASRDEERFVREYNGFLVSITGTARPGQLGFGLCSAHQTSYGMRELGKDWTGNSVYLWAIANAVYLALLDALIQGVAAELRTIPSDVSPLRALRDAHLATLGKVRSGGVPGLNSSGVALTLQILNSTDDLKLAAGQIQDPVVFRALADRMGVDPAHRRLRMVNAVWSAIIVTACGDLTPGTTSGPLGPELMAERISESYDQFRALATIAP